MTSLRSFVASTIHIACSLRPSQSGVCQIRSILVSSGLLSPLFRTHETASRSSSKIAQSSRIAPPGDRLCRLGQIGQHLLERDRRYIDRAREWMIDNDDE